MKTERWLTVAALCLMSLLPVSEMAARLVHLPGIPGSTVFVQNLTLWVAFLGATLAAASGRLLSLSANTFLPERWTAPVRVFVSAVGGAVTMGLAYAALELVRAEWQGGGILAAGVPRWLVQSVMPAGFLLLALRLVWTASPHRKMRLAAAAGLLAPAIFAFLTPGTPGALSAGLAVLGLAALLGLPIFATLGGLALLLFWDHGVTVASVPVATYQLVASPVLPSLPLYTFAGYLLVEGGADRRLLRAYSALFGWMPGGLAITTAVVCAVFTWAGSGVTILSLGGLLVPMLIKARYKESFSIGLVNASGSLGLLFPPSLPVILYGIYANTRIDTLFVAGFVPGVLMVAMVAAWGIRHGVLHHAERSTFAWREALLAVWDAKWELLLPVIILAGLFGGLGTLVEAGALTVVYAFVVECFIYRGISLRRDFTRVAVECCTVIGGVLLIVGVAQGLTNYLVDAHVPDLLTDWAQSSIHSKYVFLLMLNVVLILKGSFMDVFSAIIVLVPLVTPIAAGFGIDPVQLGIIFLANLELGYLTPPVGLNLCLSAYRFKQSMTSVYRATLPFYLILLVGVLLITYVPWLTMAPVRWFTR
jgi:tripartite ATP-independent transporter DctM subunit